MFISDVYNTQAIAAYMTESYSNRISYLGESYFPNKKKMGIDLAWIKTHKGLGVALKPSNFDAIPTIRPRGKAEKTKEEMLLFRESMIIKEHDMMELSRIKDKKSARCLTSFALKIHSLLFTYLIFISANTAKS